MNSLIMDSWNQVDSDIISRFDFLKKCMVLPVSVNYNTIHFTDKNTWNRQYLVIYNNMYKVGCIFNDSTML